MSPLTKLFVVLLVVMSLLMTAGTVVYVTRENDRLANLTAVEQRLQAMQSERDQQAAALQAANTNLAAAQAQVSAQASQAQQALTAAQQQIADLNVQLAKAQAANATQELQITRLTEGLQASQNTTAQLTQQANQLRQGADEAIRRSAEMSASISDLTNRLEVTEAERRNLAEQLAQAIGAGGRQESAQQGPVSAPPINGVIRDRRQIAGREYATISVGSADNVARGMQFRVIDRNRGEFLGTLTVDAVEPNEASGVLTGPRVGDIQPGTEVRTQY